MKPGVIRSLTRQWVPHPFHPVTVIFSFQALSWFPLSSICRSQNAASQDVIKFKMAPRGKLKAENGRYKYPFFFLYSWVFYSNSIQKTGIQLWCWQLNVASQNNLHARTGKWACVHVAFPVHSPSNARGVASPKTRPTDFCFDQSTACNKLCVVGVS